MKTLKQFYSYFKALICSPVQVSKHIVSIAAGFLVLILSFLFTANNHDNVAAITLIVISGLLFLCGVVTSLCINSKPSVASLMPVSKKRSLVYSFFSPLLLCLFVTLFILAVLFVILFIFFVFVEIFNGGALDTLSEVLYGKDEYRMDLYGGIFTVAYVVIMYAGSMLVGLIKTRKRRNWYMVGFILSLSVGIILTGMTYYHCNHVRFVASPFLSICYQDMEAPWLCVTAWCLVAAALLGTAICFGIKRSKQNY